ncbi:MAG: N-6 DNA methylase, partial [Thermoguttaceae bacterium]
MERIDRHRERQEAAMRGEAGGISAAARTTLLKLASRLSLPADARDPVRMLLAMRTYYAIVVKQLTWAVVEAANSLPPSLAAPFGREDLERFEKGERAAAWGVSGFPDASAWSWYLDAWDPPLGCWLHGLVGRVQELKAIAPAADPAAGHDLFGKFYMSLFPKQLRHALGEHYTPGWLADHGLDQVGFVGVASGRLLDPTCGSGVFLLRAIARMVRSRGESGDPGAICRAIAGLDVNSLAVLSARANYLLALRHWLSPDRPIGLPVHHRDVVLENRSEPDFEFLVGNPPWLCWDHLPEEYRRETKGLWKRYGLFSLSGNEARHGGGKKDLAMLVVY